MNNTAIRSVLAGTADPEGGRLLLSRFEEAYQETFKKNFDLKKRPPLLLIFGNSQVLAEKLICNPVWADEITNDKFWLKRKPRGEIEKELKAQIEKNDPQDVVSWQRILRHFKYKNLIRIAAADLEQTAPVDEILIEWSDVADVVIDAAYNAAVKISGDKAPCAGVVIALGKLGARELNISSDVDLLCLYERDEAGKISSHEFFTKVVSIMTKILSAVTEDGFAYRVDHDLRPEGPKGPLVNSLDAAERYYETFGADWERQALIRARPVAGDLELGDQFISTVMPFVYRRSLSLSDLTHLREMKKRMEASSKSSLYNIKLGRGGIRELEFLVQAFQQVYGGHFKSIRVQNTFDAIGELEKNHLIHPHGAERLRDSYAFLRRLENMIQIANDTQTHTLPASTREIAKLSRRMGTDKNLTTEWRRHTRLVNKLFVGMFEADYDRIELEEAMAANIATCTTDEERADSLPWFKNQEIKRLAHLDLNSKIALPQLLRRLTLVAEIVINTAWGLASKNLMKRYGEPRLDNNARASFAIIGFGRLGSAEMDYGSDLDLCFLYSGDGQTSGPEVINNGEFFTKLTQRIISLISLHTRYGRAYQIDSELRPSGNQGSLVATLESFRDYHSGQAKLWEHQSLLKARIIAGDEPFTKEIKITLTNLAFKAPSPPEEEMRSEIASLRGRFETEAAMEDDGRYNLKIGRGGVADIDAVIRYLQLANAKKHTELWVQNGFELTAALHDLSIINDENYETLSELYGFHRLLISRLRLFAQSATDILDLAASYINPLAAAMDLSPSSLREKTEDARQRTRDIYNSFLQK
jgi:glutamine synthetase adenylyltransferase